MIKKIFYTKERVEVIPGCFALGKPVLNKKRLFIAISCFLLLNLVLLIIF